MSRCGRTHLGISPQQPSAVAAASAQLIWPLAATCSSQRLHSGPPPSAIASRTRLLFGAPSQSASVARCANRAFGRRACFHSDGYMLDRPRSASTSKAGRKSSGHPPSSAAMAARLRTAKRGSARAQDNASVRASMGRSAPRLTSSAAASTKSSLTVAFTSLSVARPPD